MAVQSPASQGASEDVEVVEQATFTEINIVPLVDIMLVLLVILMATSTAILEAGQGQGSGFKVNLPTGSEKDEVASISNELVIAVLADGAVVARGEVVSNDELRGILDEEASRGTDRLVLVQADEQALHKRVVEVMEAARRAGLRNLAIATRPE